MNLAVTDTQNSRVECTNTQTQKKRISVSLCEHYRGFFSAYIQVWVALQIQTLPSRNTRNERHPVKGNLCVDIISLEGLVGWLVGVIQCLSVHIMFTQSTRPSVCH